MIAGGEEVFAAGADIATMARQEFQEAMRAPAARFWPRLRAIRKPVVAAVSGYALGGGCELALSADPIPASETATFAQPEAGLGILPGGAVDGLAPGFALDAVAGVHLVAPEQLAPDASDVLPAQRASAHPTGALDA